MRLLSVKTYAQQGKVFKFGRRPVRSKRSVGPSQAVVVSGNRLGKLYVSKQIIRDHKKT
jgi:hypothetical protein